jgi:riboflavin kinase/FMN adenylyltransferase
MRHVMVLRSMAELTDWASRPVVFTVGFFDGVHRGHQALLGALTSGAREREAHSLIITFSNSPRGYHYPEKRYPLLTLPEEKLLLLGRTGADATLMLKYDASIAAQSARQFLDGLGAALTLKAFCIGYDSKLGHDQIGGEAAYRQVCDALGIDLIFVPALTDGGRPVKSREARELVRQGRAGELRTVLGHPYFVSGKVEAGKGKGGHALKIPTANLLLPALKLAPPTGIYAGVGVVEDRRYPAAVCVMSSRQHQHTVLERNQSAAAGSEVDDGRVVVEAHLAGYSGDLYGRALRIEFLAKLRDWIDFDSEEQLRLQIRRDIAATEAAFEQESAAER